MIAITVQKQWSFVMLTYERIATKPRVLQRGDTDPGFHGSAPPKVQT